MGKRRGEGCSTRYRFPCPEHVSSKSISQFFLGPFVYFELSLALPDHAQQARDLPVQDREPPSSD